MKKALQKAFDMACEIADQGGNAQLEMKLFDFAVKHGIEVVFTDEYILVNDDVVYIVND